MKKSGIVLAAALATASVALTACGGGPTTLNSAKVQDKIVSDLAAKVGAEPVTASCPAAIPIKDGAAFDCTATLSGQSLPVKVTQGPKATISKTEYTKAVLDVDKVTTAIEDDFKKSATSGATVSAVCGDEATKYMVKAVDESFKCTLADAAGNSIEYDVTVTDLTGKISFKADPDSLKTATPDPTSTSSSDPLGKEMAGLITDSVLTTDSDDAFGLYSLWKTGGYFTSLVDNTKEATGTKASILVTTKLRSGLDKASSSNPFVVAWAVQDRSGGTCSGGLVFGYPKPEAANTWTLSNAKECSAVYMVTRLKDNIK